MSHGNFDNHMQRPASSQLGDNRPASRAGSAQRGFPQGRGPGMPGGGMQRGGASPGMTPGQTPMQMQMQNQGRHQQNSFGGGSSMGQPGRGQVSPRNYGGQQYANEGQFSNYGGGSQYEMGGGGGGYNSSMVDQQQMHMQQMQQPAPKQNFMSGIGASFGMGSKKNVQNTKDMNYFMHKRIVITGASSGVGQALAFWYLNQGAYVILVGKDEKALKNCASQFPNQATVVVTNITDDYQCKDLVDAVKDKFINLDNLQKAQATGQTTFNPKGEEEYQPKLDVLINCAGIIFAGDLDNTFPQDHDYLMDVNMRAPYVLINFFQDMLIAAQGCVINVSCIKGSKPQPGLISYCMSKAGLEMLTKSAAIELARFGVRVNCVSSSFLNTNLYRQAGLTELENDSVLQKEKDTNPMGRNGRIEEVCHAIIHLTSQHGYKITGQIINVDGGKSLTIRGQHAWYGMRDDQSRGFEVGESTSVVDFFKMKFRKNNPAANMIVNSQNQNIHQFVEQNSTSLWARKDQNTHMTYQYQKPDAQMNRELGIDQ